MSRSELHRQLSLVDWDFINQGSLDVSAIHWYPGTFAPGLPGVLVDLLSAPGDTVFDPFCGIGSAAAAALLRGRNSVSCDMSPVGVMAGLAATGLLSLLLENRYLFEQVFDDLRVIVDEIQAGNVLLDTMADSVRVDEHIDRYGGQSVDNVFPFLFGSMSIARLKNWYHPQTLSELQRLIGYLQNTNMSRFSKVVGFTMMSAISRNTSSETRSWGHIADNVLPKEFIYKDVRRAASAWIQRTKRQLEIVRLSVVKPTQTPSFRFFVVDWTKAQTDSIPGQSSLLLTSPPYGGAIDYGLAQRLTMYLMGMSDGDLTRMVGAEIGARRKRFRPGHIDRWAEQLVQVSELQLAFVAKSGYLAYVMPHKDHGRDVGELKLREALYASGWELWFSADRSVMQTRTRQSWTSIKKETIVIFRARK